MIVSDRVRGENRVVIAHVYTATAAIALGAIFGVFQGFGRTGLLPTQPRLEPLVDIPNGHACHEPSIDN